MRDEKGVKQGRASDQAIDVETTAMNVRTQAQSIPLPLLDDVWQQTLGWQPTALQQKQFQQLYDLILAGNRQLNLTRITEATEFWEKHLWDSLRGVKPFLSAAQVAMGSEGQGTVTAWQPGAETLNSVPVGHDVTPWKVIDIGTGAGFPGVPAAIAQSMWTVTLLDATRKKIHFLDQLLADLQMPNAIPIVGRVEAIGRQQGHRQTYDLALIRAVAPAAVCAEYALPLLKIGGNAVLYRGQWTDTETASLTAAVATLGGKIDAIDAFKTPLTDSDRHCVYIQKVASTPDEFPRAIGIPTQKPL